MGHHLHHAIILLAQAIVVTSVAAHADVDGGAEHGDETANLAIRVEIRTDDRFRYVTSDGLPDHATGRFPNDHNPNTIRARQHRLRMPLRPTAVERPQPTGRFLFGVAVNGVPFDPGTAERWTGPNGEIWHGEAKGGELDLGLDQHNAHVQPDGTYHYHAIPVGLLEQRAREAQPGAMVLVGWAADGFPIYGPRGHKDANDLASELVPLRSSYRLKEGARPANGPPGNYDGTYAEDYEFVAGAGDLDECNGRVGVTSEYPEGTYYYVLTEQWPFVGRMFRGAPDRSFEKQGPPPGGGRPGDRPPPRGGRGGPPGGGRPPPEGPR